MDIVELLEATFGHLKPDVPLWPMSAATFRARFKSLGRALGLPVDRPRGGGPRLELASLRGGGATDLFLATEDWGLVQTRGRWQSVVTMQIYVQELVSTSFFSQLSRAVQGRVLAVARGAPAILKRFLELQAAAAEEAEMAQQLRLLAADLEPA